MKTLDVGCGLSRLENAVCMDNNPLVNPDVLHDLEVFPYPFPENEFDYIHCSHVLEHLADVIPVMKEFHRIAKPGGLVHISVPHFSGKTAYMDPSHKKFFAWNSFTYFTKDYFYTGAQYEIVKQSLTFSKLIAAIGIGFMANKFPRFYEDYLHGIFPARNLLATLKVIK